MAQWVGALCRRSAARVPVQFFLNPSPSLFLFPACFLLVFAVLFGWRQRAPEIYLNFSYFKMFFSWFILLLIFTNHCFFNDFFTCNLPIIYVFSNAATIPPHVTPFSHGVIKDYSHAAICNFRAKHSEIHFRMSFSD